jgi:hypothetical protein
MAVLLAGPGLAQESAAIACRFCENRGEHPCKDRCHRRLLEHEQRAECCSEAAACNTCGGALTTDCKICANPAVEAGIAERRERAARWLAAMRKKVDEATAGEGILHCKGAHVELTFTVRPLTIGKRKVPTHELMHVYLERLEELRKRFLATFELRDADFSAPLQVFVFDDRTDHRRLAPRVAGGSGGAGQKLMGSEAVYCAWRDPAFLPGDEELWRSLVHNVTHLLLANMKPEIWLGNRQHGWVDEGVAHYFEWLLTERCTNFCYQEVGLTPGAGFKGGWWPVAIRKLAESGGLAPFATFYQKQIDELGWQEHAQAFAAVHFLIDRHGGRKFAEFVRALKNKTETREAMRGVFGLDVLRFDAEFETWVKASYPLER